MGTTHIPNPALIVGFSNFSPVRGLPSKELLDPFFSSFACQTCGDKKAGNRYYCSATIGKRHDGTKEKLEICEDCYLYFFS